MSSLKNNKSHSLTYRLVLIITFLSISTLSFAACSSDDDKKLTNESTSTTRRRTNTNTTTEKTQSNQNSGDVEITELNETITDPEAGYIVQLNKVIKNVPFNKAEEDQEEYNVGFLVEVTVENNSPYNFEVDSNFFSIISSASEYDVDNFPDVFSEYAQENNYDLLYYLDGIKTGEKQTVWLGFSMSKLDANDEISFVYKRIGIRKVADGTEIPAKEIKVKILD